jgi:hypothetical protein
VGSLSRLPCIWHGGGDGLARAGNRGCLLGRPYNICICSWFVCGKELCLLLVVKRDGVEPGECVCKGLELRRERCTYYWW